MEWIMVAIVVLFLATKFKPTKGVKNITTAQLRQQLLNEEKGYVYIDVRTPAEFKNRHITQFKNMPIGKDYSKLDRQKEIVVICQSGMRSMKACKQLKELGFEKITNVRGGMNAWK